MFVGLVVSVDGKYSCFVDFKICLKCGDVGFDVEVVVCEL